MLGGHYIESTGEKSSLLLAAMDSGGILIGKTKSDKTKQGENERDIHSIISNLTNVIAQ